jgi:hypothetical protein
MQVLTAPDPNSRHASLPATGHAETTQPHCVLPQPIPGAHLPRRITIAASLPRAVRHGKARERAADRQAQLLCSTEFTVSSRMPTAYLNSFESVWESIFQERLGRVNSFITNPP